MKAAISLPDDLFAEIDRFARTMRVSRSKLLALAAREYVTRHQKADDPTEAWNRAIAAAGQPGDDPAARSARRRTKAIVRSHR